MIAFLMLAGMLVIAPVPVARAATTRYVATTGSDAGNLCTNPASPCATIDWAIGRSNAGDIIDVAAGTHTEAGLWVSKDLTIRGQGAGTTIVQADPNPGSASDEVFYIFGATVTIEKMTIRHGNDPLFGGGIYNSGGTLNLNNSTLSDNWADDGGGRGGGGRRRHPAGDWRRDAGHSNVDGARWPAVGAAGGGAVVAGVGTDDQPLAGSRQPLAGWQVEG